MAIVAVSPFPHVPHFETLDDLATIRASYPVIDEWRGWWQNRHIGTLVMVSNESDLERIGFFWGRWIIEHWEKIDGDLPLPPDQQLKQLSLL